ncbi:hypothetical protein LMTR3_07765 [Bradyrhizobium sp. LMTR 3]|nr:hypothetical protein LMTR3_07765 [Bradyrhizobium sp. LMTR 3]
MAWLAKATLTAFFALVSCAFATSFFGGPPEIQPADNDGEAGPAWIAYRREPTPQSVLLGTSLTYHLKEPFFLPVSVRNLAIPGRSVLTALEIIASYPKLPDNIFVELNVMTWRADNDFIRKFSYNSGAHFQVIAPIRAIVAYLGRPADKVGVRQPVDETILNQPPAEYDNRIYIQRGRVAWSGHNHDAVISETMDAIVHIVQKIEVRGSRVYFFELPLAPGMADTDVAKTTRAVAHQHFSDASRWLQFSYPADQLRFRDHAHLDERSALIVAHAMRDAMTAKH